MLDTDAGLVCAYRLDAGQAELDWDAIRAGPPGAHWVHLERTAPASLQWLKVGAGLDPLICEALLAEETRPRIHREAAGTLLILRGVNLNPGADPEDMVSLRIWVDGQRVISLRQRPLLAVRDLRQRLDRGQGPTSPAALVTALANGLGERIGPVVDGLEEQLDGLEEQLIDGAEAGIRSELSHLRRQAVALRRYLAPQRDVLLRLAAETLPGFTDSDRARCRELADRMLRHVEDLDALRERAAVTQEELVARVQDRMNRNMYLLSLVAAVFLPLGFLTGLFGINVGGMPGVDSEAAFAIVCIVLVIIVAGEVALLRVRRWL